MKAQFWARRIIMFILIGAIAILVFGGIVMLLWNNILAQVTNVQNIKFLQALGILVLSKILFGGFRGAWGGKRYYWKQRMMSKWNNMTPRKEKSSNRNGKSAAAVGDTEAGQKEPLGGESSPGSERENIASEI